jgi:hypothetical protein
VQHGAVLGRHGRRVEDVLQRDGHAVQGAQRLARATPGVGRGRERERALGIEEGERLYRPFDALHLRETGPHELGGADAPGADQERRLGRAELVQRGLGGRGHGPQA